MNKLYQTTLMQLAVLCEGHTNSTDLLNAVKKEVSMVDTAESRFRPKGNTQEVRLYKTLHLTRAFDTSLETFLSIYGKVPSDMRKHTIAGYAYSLTNPSGLFHPLDGITKKIIVDDIASARNKFMHKANSYPSKTEFNKLENKICTSFQVVLTLKK